MVSLRTWTSPGLRERKRERTRQAIADAALELFARQGFHETTIPQIAEAADVSPRTVSGYFPAKEDLAFPDADERIGRARGAAALARARRDRRRRAAGVAAGRWSAADADRAAELRTRRAVIDADERAVRVRAPLHGSRAGRARRGVRRRPRPRARRARAADGGRRDHDGLPAARPRPRPARRGSGRSRRSTARSCSSAAGSARCAAASAPRRRRRPVRTPPSRPAGRP